jgi:hypothetical protein
MSKVAQIPDPNFLEGCASWISCAKRFDLIPHGQVFRDADGKEVGAWDPDKYLKFCAFILRKRAEFEEGRR